MNTTASLGWALVRLAFRNLLAVGSACPPAAPADQVRAPPPPGNWFAAYSNNGGGTWSFLNRFTEFSTAGTGGFCCDQEVMYDPRRDIMFWLLQYIQTGKTTADNNRLRLAFFRNTSSNIVPTSSRYGRHLPQVSAGPPPHGRSGPQAIAALRLALISDPDPSFRAFVSDALSNYDAVHSGGTQSANR